MATIDVAKESTSQEILSAVGGFSAENDKVYWAGVMPTSTSNRSVETDTLVLSVDGSGELLTSILFLLYADGYYGSSGNYTYPNYRIKLVVDDVVMCNIQAQLSSDYNSSYPEYHNCSIGFSSVADWYDNSSSSGFFKGLVYKYGYNYIDKHKPNRNNGSSRLIDFSEELYTEATKLTSYEDDLANVFIYKEDPIKFNKGFKIYIGYDYAKGYQSTPSATNLQLYARYKLRG